MHRLLVILLGVFFACSTPKPVVDNYAHIPDQKVVFTLKKSFKTLGILRYLSGIKIISMRRFCFRPSSVSFVSTGL